MNSSCEIDDHAGIVADDPELREATVTLTNNLPYAVTGYWTLSIPQGHGPDGLGGGACAYRQVGSAWQEVIGGQQVLVTIGAGQTLEVPLLLEGAADNYDGNLTATFHVINLADEVLANGLAGAFVPDATDDLSVKVRSVDLSVGSSGHTMPEVYEDTLASVIPMNRDYDDGYVDSNLNPLPDGTDPLPTGATPPPACSGEDDLVSGTLALPSGFHGTWTLTIPTGLRVWQYVSSAWSEVESDTPYVATSGGTLSLRVEGLSATSAAAYLSVSAQYTDENDEPIGLPLTDRVKVEVVSVDLQIQSISEYDEATRAASVPVNDDYDENDTHPISGEAVADNNRLHGQLVSAKLSDGPITPGIVPDDDDLVHGTLTIAGPSGQTGRYWIEVTGEPAMLVDHPDLPGYNQYGASVTGSRSLECQRIKVTMQVITGFGKGGRNRRRA